MGKKPQAEASLTRLQDQWGRKGWEVGVASVGGAWERRYISGFTALASNSQSYVFQKQKAFPPDACELRTPLVP